MNRVRTAARASDLCGHPREPGDRRRQVHRRGRHEQRRHAGRQAPPVRLRQGVVFLGLLVALSVFSPGGGLSIYHGISAPHRAEPLQDPLWNHIVPGVSTCFEGYRWNVSRRELNKRRKPGASLWQTVHARRRPCVRRGMRIDEVEAAIERLEHAVAAAYPAIRHIYFESGALRAAMR